MKLVSIIFPSKTQKYIMLFFIHTNHLCLHSSAYSKHFVQRPYHNTIVQSLQQMKMNKLGLAISHMTLEIHHVAPLLLVGLHSAPKNALYRGVQPHLLYWNKTPKFFIISRFFRLTIILEVFKKQGAKEYCYILLLILPPSCWRNSYQICLIYHFM